MAKQLLIEYGTHDLEQCTHMFMNGGKLSVSEHKRDEFWELYIHLVQKHGLSLVEKIPKRWKFNMFIDIDVKNCIVSEEIIQMFFETNKIDQSCVVCVGHNTCGIHIIFYDYLVCSNEACEIIKNLKCDFGKLDSSVYYTGLRMVYSWKKDIKQYYYPKYFYIERILSNIECENIEIAKKTSIHANNKIPCLNTKQIQCMPVKNSNINTKFLENISAKYKNITITSVKKYMNCYILYTDTKYCTNIERDHNSRTVYFVVNNQKVYQKCFCRCSDKTCSTYRSVSVDVPFNVHLQLNTH